MKKINAIINSFAFLLLAVFVFIAGCVDVCL